MQNKGRERGRVFSRERGRGEERERELEARREEVRARS